MTESHRLPEWQHEKAGKRNCKEAGVVINFSPRNAVKIREGLMRSAEIDPDTAEATADSPIAPVKHKAVYPAPLRRYLAWHKTLAVQEVLLADARMAKEVAAVHGLLALRPHEAVRQLAKSAQPQISYEVIETQTAVIVRLRHLEQSDGDTAWQTLSSGNDRDRDATDLYRRVKALSDAELGQLQTVLAVLPFGQLVCEQLDTDESLFNAVAADLKVDMRNHWRPDADFLNRRTRGQLVAIAQECLYADGLSGLHTWKRAELASGLLRHFEQARQAAQPTDAQRKALTWLPEAMLFPAVDPDPGASESGDDEPPFETDDDDAADSDPAA